MLMRLRIIQLGLIVAVLGIISPAVLSTPNAYAETITISEDASFVEETIEAGDTVIVEEGASLFISAVVNKGAIINRGQILLGPFASLTNDGGSIINSGLMDFGLADFINKNGGSVENENGASITFRQAGSPAGHVFENGQGSTVRNAGLISLDDVFSLVNNGTFVNECGGSLLLKGPSSGNPIVDECTSPTETALLQVKSVDISGNEITGMWTTIRSTPDGALVESGFTPLFFDGEKGQSYKVTVSNYDGRIFSNWENSMLGNSRIIALAENTTITAEYETGDSLRGFTSLAYAGTAEQPDLTINALSIDGGTSLHMWTIIDPQVGDSPTETTYKVYASNYKHIVFDHWSDGSVERIRTMTISEATTLTAYYSIAPPAT